MPTTINAQPANMMAARPALIVTSLRTALRDQRRLEFFRGGEQAGEAAARRGLSRFERHQGGLRVSSAHRVHGEDNMDAMVNAELPRFHQVVAVTGFATGGLLPEIGRAHV